jgi:two-component system, cell cycle sensor histidine kinase and response regulator CckA
MMKTTMKLQYKAWALVFAIVGLCASSAMFGARYIVAESFAQLETDRAEREGERARRVLDQQVQGLGATVRDYAYWGEAVEFIRGRKPGFMSDNFDADNLGYLRISEVAVFDGKGKLKASVTLDAQAHKVDVPTERIEPLRSLVSAVLTSADPKFMIRTLRAADGALDVVVAAAVHRPDAPEQGAQGAMVMVRRFDQAEVARLSEVLMMPARLSFEDPEHGGQSVHVNVIDDQNAELHAVLKDYRDRPVAELVLGLDRKLEEQGRALTWQGMGLAALAGLAASLLLVPLLDRLLLRRLQGLHTDLQRVTAEGPGAGGQIRVAGADELSQLSEGINGLLSRVRADAQTQREAHEKQEALQVQLMQSQKTEALGRLTGGIAHDFNNSLAAITGWVRLASEDLDSAHPSHEALQQALKSTRYADGLMRQLLAFGRQSAPRLRRLHWSGLIEETRQMVSAGLTKDCELVVNYQVDDDEVDADPTQLQQVLVNLLINAADAMKGSGRIELTLEGLVLPVAAGQDASPGASGLPEGRYLVLRVRDHGPGIPPEHLDRVFDPFFTTKAKGRGTGLGLSVAQGIMARHHGTIGLTNGPEGACFILYLPASRHDETVAPITSPGGPGRGRQLLFVDDDQSVRHAWSALLERKGWQVTRSRDGEEAWAQFSQTGKHFDVVLTDQSMPRLDGVGLAQRIRATESPPPVVLMSGHVDEVDAGLLKTLFAGVLHKPVEPGELDRVLQGLPLAEPVSVTQY